jgi:hypothetical protein
MSESTKDGGSVRPANWCKVYARRTPMIPFHNGMYTYRIGHEDGTVSVVRQPCLGCGAVDAN